MTGDQTWWYGAGYSAARLKENQDRIFADKAAREAAQQQNQGYAAQSALMAQQAQHDADARAQEFAGRSALSAQEANQTAALAQHHVDLQARLQQVTLDQTENDRLAKLRHARASIEDNPDLSPYEQHMLITQLESGINPLEARQREQAILESAVRTHAMNQEAQQQATRFGQQQDILQMSAEQRMRTIRDENTGLTQRFYLNNNGEWQPLDFSQSAEIAQARRENIQAQTEATQQGTTIEGMMAPGRFDAQEIANRRAQQAFDQLARTNPLDVERMQHANALAAQHLIQNPQAFALAQALGTQQLAGLRQEYERRENEDPHNLTILEGRARIAQELARRAPESAQAQLDYERAHANHMMQTVMNMPNVREARDRYGAETDHARATASIAQAELARIQAGGLPWAQAGAIVNHAIGTHEAALEHLRRQIQDAPASQRPALQARYDELQRNVPHPVTGRLHNPDVTTRAEQAEDAFRAVAGMPARVRPQAPAGNPAVNGGPVAPIDPVLQELGRQAAALPDVQRHGVQADLDQLRDLMARFPGGFNTMPLEAQQRVMELRQNIRGAIQRPAAPAAPGGGRPPAPGWLERLGNAWGG